MKTKKQEELINSFLSPLDDTMKSLYQDIAACLDELGYNPKNERSNISFKHDLHNKQIAKMGMKKGKSPYPFFALRFSACRGYSQRFSDVVGEAIIKNPTRAPRCTSDGCNFCAGDPDTHVYSHKFPDGEIKSHCGAYVLEIPEITVSDLDEIKTLIKEEHEYLLKHEVGRA